MRDILDKFTDFKYDFAYTYAEAEALLKKYTYDFSVVDLNLPDATSGQSIPLVNRYGIAPIIFTGLLSDDIRDTFESSNIVDYVLKERYDNILYVIEKLLQLQANRKKKVLIVEDSFTYRYYLKNNLSMHQFNIYEASHGKDALDIIAKHPDIELVLTDYHMPVMDGLELTRKIRKKFSKKDMAIIALSSETKSYITSKFLKEGANDFITKPFSRDEFYARIYQNIDELEIFNQVKDIFEHDIISLLCEVTEYKSAETGAHIKRIREYTTLLAKLNGAYEEEAKMIGRMAALHDIGKIAIPDSILAKPGKLTPEEFDIIKTHSSHGKNILEEAFKSNPKAGAIAIDIAYFHHEKYDGSGYPLGYKGDNIPINARIVGLVDCFDALANNRAYKKAWMMSDIINYIESESGKSFDPRLVKIFIKHIDKFTDILHKHIAKLVA
jgi:putative two-component system response regulator